MVFLKGEIVSRFVALDLETANPCFSSICQIGAVRYEDGIVVDEFLELVNPNDYFCMINVSIHGIDEDRVKDSRLFSDVFNDVVEFVGDDFCFTHTSFDRTAIIQACKKYDIAAPDIKWRDSSMVARRTWKQFKQKGWGLDNLCNFLGFDFNHHDALEDAKAAGHVVLAAASLYEKGFDGLEERLGKPLSSPFSYKKDKVEPCPEGVFFGQKIVFTGSLSVVRREAVAIAAKAGFRAVSGVTSKTDVLVVGDQDVEKLRGKPKSSKHLKAESLIKDGVKIKIIKETDFFEMCEV